jgi:hypothetical protein
VGGCYREADSADDDDELARPPPTQPWRHRVVLRKRTERSTRPTITGSKTAMSKWRTRYCTRATRPAHHNASGGKVVDAAPMHSLNAGTVTHLRISLPPVRWARHVWERGLGEVHRDLAYTYTVICSSGLLAALCVALLQIALPARNAIVNKGGADPEFAPFPESGSESKVCVALLLISLKIGDPRKQASKTAERSKNARLLAPVGSSATQFFFGSLRSPMTNGHGGPR